MQFNYGYGKVSKQFEIDDKNILMELHQNKVNMELTGAEEVQRALKNPIASKKLSEIVNIGEKIVIITSDITRPMPSKTVLPYILKELYTAGLKDEDITIVFALGSHRKQKEEEKKYLVGEDIYSRINCIDSDVNDCVRMGVTQMGTPVDIFKTVAEADRRICLGI